MSEKYITEFSNETMQDICKFMIQRNILMSLKINLIHETLTSVFSLIKQTINNTSVPAHSKEKLYNAMVQCVTKIILFKPDELSGTPSILYISDYKEYFSIQAGNYILNSQIPLLKQELKNQKVLNKDELNALYKSWALEKKLSGSKYLGVLDIVILTNSELSYEIHSHSNHFSFLIIQRLLKKSI